MSRSPLNERDENNVINNVAPVFYTTDYQALFLIVYIISLANIRFLVLKISGFYLNVVFVAQIELLMNDNCSQHLHISVHSLPDQT